MRYNTFMAIVATASLTFACNKAERITVSGIKVEIVEKGDGKSIADSTVIRMNMRYVNSNGNEQWNSTNIGPATIPYNKEQWEKKGTVYEAFSVLNGGDSAIFKIATKELYDRAFNVAVPDSLDSASYMTFYVRVLSIMTTEEFQAFQKEEYEKNQAKAQEERVATEAKRLADAADQIKKDGETIDQYLSENKIIAVTTDSGLRYVVTQAGEGDNAPNGANVTVHYHGTLMDGTKFDSSYDRNEPFQFVLGQGRVIRGWDEGIALLNKGAKATFYIPSSLGYGERETGAIPANAILKFDVELLDF